MNHAPDRRSFLTSAAGLSGMGLLWPKTGFLFGKDAPSNQFRVGVVGVGGRGTANWSDAVHAGATIAAFADVDESRTGPIRKAHPQAKAYTDFRKLLDAEKLDGLIVSTPDHTHAVAAYAGLQHGLHLYCEKPLTHSVWEARLLATTAAKQKRVTQMGTQIHAGSNYRRVVELIQSGAIGSVAEVHVWCAKSWGGGDRPKETPPLPPGLHWDLWLGPAAERPYHPAYHPFNWRKYWAFGGGTLADMACHYMDLPFWALKLRHPTKVHADGPPPHPETAALALKVRWEFPAREGMPPVALHWYDGGTKPKDYADALTKWGDGVLFVGSKGMLLADYGRWKLLPEKEFQGFTPPTPTIPESIGHHREWVEACRGNGATTCHFDYSGALTETVLLGVVAYRCGKELNWDATSLRATNAPEADPFLKRAYRKGWEIG